MQTLVSRCMSQATLRRRVTATIAVIGVSALVLAFAAPAAHAQFSAFGDFSTTNNPNGNWRYGQTSTLGSSFSLINGTYSRSFATGWQGVFDGGYPVVAKYTVPNASTLLMHPSSNGTLAVTRFIAPTAGTFVIAGKFENGDSATTDVHVLVNNLTAFNSNITAAQPSTSFNITRTLNIGDTVDFAVGTGNGAFQFDSTGLAATITASAPEPGTLALIALGGLALGVRKRRSSES